MIARLLKMVSGFGRGRSNAPTTPTRTYTPANTRASERQFFEQLSPSSPAPSAELLSAPSPARCHPPIGARRGWRLVFSLRNAAIALYTAGISALIAQQRELGAIALLPAIALSVWLASALHRAELRPYGSKYPPPNELGPTLASSAQKRSTRRSALERAKARVRAANSERASERRAS